MSTLPPRASFWVKPEQRSHFVWVALCFVCLTMTDKGTSLSRPGLLSSGPLQLPVLLAATAFHPSLRAFLPKPGPAASQSLAEPWPRGGYASSPEWDHAKLPHLGWWLPPLNTWHKVGVPLLAHSLFQPFILLFNFFKYLFIWLHQVIVMACGIFGLPGWLSCKEPVCNAGDAWDAVSIPGLGRSPSGEDGNPL